MSPITTHVLDVSRGKPASEVDVRLDYSTDDGWQEAGSGRTDDDGRVASLQAGKGELVAGTYRLIFEVGEYFQAREIESFYSRIAIEFEVRDEFEHYHVPLLLSPYGYSTYRGS